MLIVLLVVAVGVGFLVHWEKHRLRALQGAIVVLDSDPRKELPVSGVEVTATIGPLTEVVKSDSSGFFVIKTHPGIRRGERLTLAFRHPNYRPLVLQEYVSDHLYVIHLLPRNAVPPEDEHKPLVRISNVGVRYSVKTLTQANIGSTVKTFQVENKGNVPCRNQTPCSPDGRWKAATGSTSIDAGPENEFHDLRISCIAGPCPFTRINPIQTSKGGEVVSISARDWSDTATFLVEAEVLHPMSSEIAHEFYPVIFGKGMSFTLPAAVEGVTIVADIDGQEIFFPLGPDLFLSWANCTSSVNPDQTKVYRCELKPGYRFQ